MSDSPVTEIQLQPRQEDLVKLAKDHKFTMAYGVSRGGKSFLFILLMITRALKFAKSNHVIIRETYNSIDTTIWPTVMDVIDALHPDYRAKLDITLTPRRITFDNGSTIWFMGAQDEEAILKLMGAEFATIFLNEAREFTYKVYARVLTRLNAKETVVDDKGNRIKLKVYADCNPSVNSNWVYQQWCAGLIPGTKEPLFNPDAFAYLQFDRDANTTVDPEYYAELQNLPYEERMSYLEGEWRDEVVGALFSREDLNNNREPLPSRFDAVIVGNDPAMTNTPKSDETGIIAVGAVNTEMPDGTIRRDLYPIADVSGRYHPNDWARKTVELARAHNADAVIIETTQGGDSNANNLRNFDSRINILTVNPGRGQGKNIRAIPIGSHMKAGGIHFPHDSTIFKELEEQLYAMTGDYDRKSGKSPDRLDAFVYACAELLSWDGGPAAVVSSKVAGFWR